MISISLLKTIYFIGFYPYEETDLGHRYVLDLVLPFLKFSLANFSFQKKLEEIGDMV